MIKIEKVDVYGFEPALRGMRNPKKSWDKSDSQYCNAAANCEVCFFCDAEPNKCNNLSLDNLGIGKSDHELAMKLVKAGSEHAKFRRMIAVWVDITAPRYFWTEFDTYKISTVSNSESTMHTIHKKPFELDDFSHEKCEGRIQLTFALEGTIKVLNKLREDYLENNDKDTWYQMIQLLPQSYNQKRTIFLSYEVLANMYRQRKSHKLDEWRDFCEWIETLPYSEFITGEEK